MYSKSELKEIKKDFWTSFGQFSQLKRSRLGYPKKWMLYRTKLKGLELKFGFNNNKCITAIEIDLSISKSEDYISKIKLLKNEISHLSTYSLHSEYIQENNKTVYRFFFEKDKLTLKDKSHWPDIFNFFFEQMIILEQFIIENKIILE